MSDIPYSVARRLRRQGIILQPGERLPDNAAPDGAASHIPVLLACVQHCPGPALECGCGCYSTPILHVACMGRQLLTLDSKQPWLDVFAYLQSPNHEFAHADDAWTILRAPQITQIRWAVAFVDNNPNGTRPAVVRAVAAYSRILVVHDTEPAHDDLYHWGDSLDGFRYRYDEDRWGTRTTALSDSEPLDWLAGILPIRGVP